MHNRVGLMIGRFQPLHNRHKEIIDYMLQECSVVVIGIGSAQLCYGKRHPFTVHERELMVRLVFPTDKIKIIKLHDITIDGNPEQWVVDVRWMDYVLDEIKKNNIPAPTDYYSGSFEDARWYFDYFADPKKDRFFVDKNMLVYENNIIDRRLHILDRQKDGALSATKIRELIFKNDPEWKFCVPSKLIGVIEKNRQKFLDAYNI